MEKHEVMYTIKRSCLTCRFGSDPYRVCMAPESEKPRHTAEGQCTLYAMSAFAFLDRLPEAQRRVVRLEREIAKARDRATHATAIYGVVGSRGAASGSKVENNACSYLDLCADMEAELQQMRQIVRETKDIISKLGDRYEREVLEDRYIYGMGWEDISYAMQFEERHVRRIYMKALQHVQREMDQLEYRIMKPGWQPKEDATPACMQ